jgi:hypothetical protein
MFDKCNHGREASTLLAGMEPIGLRYEVAQRFQEKVIL